MRVLPGEGQVIVDGVDMAKRKRTRQAHAHRQQMQGGIIDKDMPIHVSNVALVCGNCGKPTRIGYRFDDDGKKVRVCRKCGR